MDNFRIAGLTDVGVSRQNNEDNLITFDSPIGRVVAVCDGMGGENGGETASSMAVGIIEDIIKNNEFTDPNDAIIGSINAANQAVLHRSMMQPQLAGMGSTCVMAIISNGRVYYGSVGDSRIYYYNPNEGLIQLTKDQSYVQTLVDAGEITEEEAENHPRKNEILNAIGLDGMQPATVCDAPLLPAPGSILLLCSDGLSGMVPNMTIKHVLARRELSIEEKVQKLINLANEAGGLDNITVQLVEFGQQTESVATPVQSSVDMQQNNPLAQPSAKPKKGFSLLFPILAALIVLGAAGAAWYFLTKDKKEDKPVVETTIKENVKTAEEEEDAPKAEKSEKSEKSGKSEKSKTVIVEEKRVVKKDVVTTPKKPETSKNPTTKNIENAASATNKREQKDQSSQKAIKQESNTSGNGNNGNGNVFKRKETPPPTPERNHDDN